MQSSKMNGSLTHVRYGHTTRPTCLEVLCPSCGERAFAKKPSEVKFKSCLVSDLSPTYRVEDWEIKCHLCLHRASGIAYESLPDLYYSGNKLNVWAWNTDHAKCIIKYLSGQDTSDNPYDWLMTYVRGEWKKKSKLAISELQKCITKLS